MSISFCQGRRRFYFLAVLLLLCVALVLWSKSSSEEQLGRTSFARNLRVVVVEEHHEVLPYWHETQGRIQILHVDGHEDGSPPLIVSERIETAMSSNDIFMVGGALLGKVAGYSWVWPSWDTQGPTHEMIDRFLQGSPKDGKFLCRAGSMTVRNVDNVALHMGCQCLYKDQRLIMCEFGDEDYEDAFSAKHGSPKEPSGHRAIEKVCDFTKEFPVQHMSEVDMQKGHFITAREFSPEQVVLDIDLDYFGVLAPIDTTMLMGGIDDAELQIIQQVMITLRVDNVKDETKINHALRVETKDMWLACWSDAALKPTCDANSYQMSDQLKSNLGPHFREFFSGDQKAKHDFEKLGAALHRIVRSDPNAASVILGIGFCLQTTPATYRHPSGGYEGNDSEADYGMKFCLDRPLDFGRVHNAASAAAVAANNNPSVIASRLIELKKALQQEPTRPVMVTICRSVRDGYTPWNMWPQIESGVLQLLRELFGNLNVHYDKNLLGGPRGWAEHAAPL